MLTLPAHTVSLGTAAVHPFNAQHEQNAAAAFLHPFQGFSHRKRCKSHIFLSRRTQYMLLHLVKGRFYLKSEICSKGTMNSK